MSKKIDKNNGNDKLYDNMYTSSMSKTPKTNAVPKKRGRRPKKIVTDDELQQAENDKSTPKSEGSAVILRMNIDPEKLKKFDGKFNSKQRVVQPPDDGLNEESSDGIFRNDIPQDSICKKCVKHEKAIAVLKNKLLQQGDLDKKDDNNKMHFVKINMVSLETNKKIATKKNNVWCLWDGHPFDNPPFYLPDNYHNGTYHVLACFCSPNCAAAHNLYYIKDSRVHQRKTLIYKMYREMTGMDITATLELHEAPLREILVNFGGTKTIEQFRKTFLMMNKEYIMYVPPLRPINSIIEERNTDNELNDEKKYVLRRKTPMKKNNSIMASMKIGDNDD